MKNGVKNIQAAGYNGEYGKRYELNQQIGEKKAHHFLGLDQFIDVLWPGLEYKFIF